MMTLSLQQLVNLITLCERFAENLGPLRRLSDCAFLGGASFARAFVRACIPVARAGRVSLVGGRNDRLTGSGTTKSPRSAKLAKGVDDTYKLSRNSKS